MVPAKGIEPLSSLRTLLPLIFLWACMFSPSHGVFPAFAPDNISAPTNPGAVCMNISDIPASYLPDPRCLDYINYDKVYVDPLTKIRVQVAQLTMTGGFLTPECLFWEFRLFCVNALRPCVEVTDPITNATIAVGSYSCRTVCDNWVRSCYDTIVRAVINVPGTTPEDVAAATSCDHPWPSLFGNTSTFETFPNASVQTYDVPASNGTIIPVNLTIYCDVLSGVNVTTAPFNCPVGFHTVGPNQCGFNCPVPLLSDSEFDAITIMTSVMGWISLVATGFLLITLLLDPFKRQYPSVLSIFFTICVMFVSFSFCLANMVGWRDLGCADEVTFNYFGDAACTIQGMIFVYFTLASVLWWLVMAFNLFLIIVFGVKMRTLHWVIWLQEWRNGKSLLSLETLFVCYHLFCWLPPIITLIISVSNERLGYGQDLWCTIHSNPEIVFTLTGSGSVEYAGGDPANTWNLLLLSVPILLSVLLGVIMLIAVLIAGAIKTGWKFLVQQWRLFCFLFFYVWIYVFVFSFQIQSGVVADDQYAAYAKYLDCQFVAETSLAILGYSPVSCEVDQKVSFPLWFIVVFNEASQGLMVFFIFGTSWRLFKAWYRLFTNPRWVLGDTSAASTRSPAVSKNFSSKRTGDTAEEIFSAVDAAGMGNESAEMDDLETSDESSFNTEDYKEDSDKGESDDDKGERSEEDNKHNKESEGASSVDTSSMEEQD